MGKGYRIIQHMLPDTPLVALSVTPDPTGSFSHEFRCSHCLRVLTYDRHWNGYAYRCEEHGEVLVFLDGGELDLGLVRDEIKLEYRGPVWFHPEAGTHHEFDSYQPAHDWSRLLDSEVRPDGSWPTLDVGIVHDPAMFRRNGLQIFAEEFHSIKEYGSDFGFYRDGGWWAGHSRDAWGQANADGADLPALADAGVIERKGTPAWISGWLLDALHIPRPHRRRFGRRRRV